MSRKLTIAILPLILALSLVACNSDSDSEPTPTLEPTATEAAPTEPAGSFPGDVEPGSAGEAFFGALEPGSLGDQFGEGEYLGEADPELTAIVVRGEDLPGAFVSLGGFSGSVSTPGGEAQVASREFATGDYNNGELGSAVMSTVAQLPPGALPSSFEALDIPTESEIDELLSGDSPHRSLRAAGRNGALPDRDRLRHVRLASRRPRADADGDVGRHPAARDRRAGAG
jgi:hypothetical protein